MEKSNTNFISSVFKGVLISIIFVLIGILFYAFISCFFVLSPLVTKIVAQSLKVISIFIACIISVRESKGLIKGALIGLITVVIEYLLIYLLMGSSSFSSDFLLEVLFGVSVGAIAGIISISLRKS